MFSNLFPVDIVKPCDTAPVMRQISWIWPRGHELKLTVCTNCDHRNVLKIKPFYAIHTNFESFIQVVIITHVDWHTLVLISTIKVCIFHNYDQILSNFKIKMYYLIILFAKDASIFGKRIKRVNLHLITLLHSYICIYKSVNYNFSHVFS